MHGRGGAKCRLAGFKACVGPLGAGAWAYHEQCLCWIEGRHAREQAAGLGVPAAAWGSMLGRGPAHNLIGVLPRLKCCPLACAALCPTGHAGPGVILSYLKPAQLTPCLHPLPPPGLACAAPRPAGHACPGVQPGGGGVGQRPRDPLHLRQPPHHSQQVSGGRGEKGRRNLGGLGRRADGCAAWGRQHSMWSVGSACAV